MSPLEALASYCGIELAFEDALGVVQRADQTTLRALLAAMGVEAVDEAAAGQQLRALERADWEQPLPPVTVLACGAGLELDVKLRPDCTDLLWRIDVEEGRARSGHVPVERLPLLARREFDEATYQCRRLSIEVDLPAGYHRLVLDLGDGRGDAASTVVIVTPGRCWLPAGVGTGAKMWGVAAQLYLVRSAREWGIGDFGDLRVLVDMLARRGADVIGLNPLHAMFVDAPERASPYSPASRLLLNVLYIDVEAVPEFARCAAAQSLVRAERFQSAIARCRAARFVDYTAVAELKLAALRLLYEAARAEADSSRWREFERFRAEHGALLERGCLFLALRAHFAAAVPPAADWHAWPLQYRDPTSAAVQRFAQMHADAVEWQAWLQFVADAQLNVAAAAAESMAVGLYRDLAVGADRSGAETWANQAAVVDAVAVGAPPDIYNPAGQNWGLPPFNPRALRAEAYRSFIDLLRANMRHAGGLRIDHVMALEHLYWIPHGAAPRAGAYVSYPLEELLGIVALESMRHRCLVVGEDLGTVPAGFRERMAAAQVLSYRVLMFERDAKGFVAPERYPPLALAVAGNHDLPTVHAWWRHSDLALKRALHLYPTSDDASRAEAERHRDQADLIAALREVGLEEGDDHGIDAVLAAVHRFLALCHAGIALVQLDDITDESAPVNVPTTSDQYPNWRRRLSLTLEQIDAECRFAAITGVFKEVRGSVAL